MLGRFALTATTWAFPSSEGRPCTAGGMGTSCNFDLVCTCSAEKLLESRAQIVVQSESLAALSLAMQLSSPKMLMNAFAAEMALVLDEVNAEPGTCANRLLGAVCLLRQSLAEGKHVLFFSREIQ